MALASLDGSKTQTRRIVELKPHHQITEREDGSLWPWMYDSERDADHWLPCRYGQPGDTLWVREAWRAPLSYELTKPSDIPPGTPLNYEADGGGNLPRFNAGKLRPSMFMPRWASRITLEITGVRVERLQDISDADCIAEGIGLNPSAEGVTLTFPPGASACKAGYQALWEHLNGPESWEANPWVWVISFRKV